MKRLRESEGLRWLALVLMAVFTTACASWQPVEGPDLPDRVRVITTARDTIKLDEPRAQGDSILSGRDVQTNAMRVIPTESVLSIERNKTHVWRSVAFVASAFVIVGTVVAMMDGGIAPEIQW